MGDRMSSGAELLGPLLLREKYEDMEGWYGRLRTWPVCGAEETAMMYALGVAAELSPWYVVGIWLCSTEYREVR